MQPPVIAQMTRQPKCRPGWKDEEQHECKVCYSFYPCSFVFILSLACGALGHCLHGSCQEPALVTVNVACIMIRTHNENMECECVFVWQPWTSTVLCSLQRFYTQLGFIKTKILIVCYVYRFHSLYVLHLKAVYGIVILRYTCKCKWHCWFECSW